MKIGKSIVSGAKARELLAGLRSKQDSDFSCERIQLHDTQLSLRYARRGRERSGSIVFNWHVSFDPGFSPMGSLRANNRVYMPDDERIHDRLSSYIYCLLHKVAAERVRVEAVKRADALAVPLQADPAFQAQVELWEKQDGKFSDYQTMTVEEAERWVERIKRWKLVLAKSSGVSSIKLCEAQA